MSNSLLPQQKCCHSRNQHNVTCWHNTVMTFFIFTYLDNGLSNDLYNINGWNLDGNTKISFKENAFGNVMTTSSETNDWDAVIVTIFRLWCQRCCHVVSYDNLQCLSDDKVGIIATFMLKWGLHYTNGFWSVAGLLPTLSTRAVLHPNFGNYRLASHNSGDVTPTSHQSN